MIVARITFAIPYYENIGYLSAALKSVRAQSRPDWNAVVVDDGVKEAGARELVADLRDPRISYVRNPGNQGIGRTWNVCLDVARTELVTILHADDELLPGYADVILRAADRYPEPVAFFCRAGLIDEEGLRIRSAPDLFKSFLAPRADPRTGVTVLRGEPAARSLLQGNFLVAPSLCYRRERLAGERFSSRWRFVLDLDFYLRLLLRGDVLLGCPDVALLWRRHAETTTARLTRTLERFREEAEFLNGMVAPLSEVGWVGAAKIARRKTIRKLHLGFLATNDIIRLRPREAVAKFFLLGEFFRDSATTMRTDEAVYAHRLVDRETRWWKRLLAVQAPYRWHLRRLRPGLVLDIGCGTGRNLAHLNGHGVGVDHNRVCVDVARKRGLTAFTPEDFDRSDYARRRVFDTVLLAHVTEHMSASEAEALVRQYLPLVKRGGKVIFITPQEAGYRSDSTHVKFLDFAALDHLGRTLGILPSQAYSFPFPRWAGRVFKYNEFVWIGRIPNGA